MASTYLTPGVYVEEVASSSATLSAGATAVAAFVGFTAKAPTDDPKDPQGLQPRLVTNWSQFEDLYGGFVPGAMLPHSVTTRCTSEGMCENRQDEKLRTEVASSPAL